MNIKLPIVSLVVDAFRVHGVVERILNLLHFPNRFRLIRVFFNPIYHKRGILDRFASKRVRDVNEPIVNAVFLDGRVGILAVAIVGVPFAVWLLVVEIDVGF